MQIRRTTFAFLIILAAVGAETGCAKKVTNSVTSTVPLRHEHHPPHGGTPVVLGDETYHLELVLDAARGTLQAYMLDGEMENFVRVSAPSFSMSALINGAAQTLILRAVASQATGETVGDTALFEAQADWLKTTKEFDATLDKIAIRGTTFTDVKFNFPKGNDRE